MFDHEQLERFRIPERRLPPDSIVINRPSSLYARYRGVLWAFFTVVAALAVLLALSWLYIASQQRLKRRLRRSEERLSLALAATASGIWEYYPKTRKAYYDARWFTMLGYEPGSLPPEYESWADLLHPEDRARTEQAVQRYVEREGLLPGVPHALPGRPMALDLLERQGRGARCRRAAPCASSAPTWTSASASGRRRSWSRPTRTWNGGWGSARGSWRCSTRWPRW